MPQDPILADQISIEPGAAGSRIIDRDPTDGTIRFTDPENLTGITLSQSSGLRSITRIITVGKGGPGAEHTLIQDAIDAVSAGSSLTDPTLILVGPGVYSENLTIEKDGIWILGLGGAIIIPAAVSPTITVQSNVSTDPNWLRLQNLRILQTNATVECILISGGAASVVGSSEIGIVDCELVASGAGAHQVRADTVNTVRVQGGTFGGSASTSLSRFTNCFDVRIFGVERVRHLQLDYDTGNPIPTNVGSTYHIQDVALGGDILSTLTGTGSLTVGSVAKFSTGGDLTCGGDGAGSFLATNCDLKDVIVNGSAPLVIKNCSRDSIAGAGTIAEDTQQGSLAFTASASEAFVFPVDQPDAAYQVLPETELTEAIGVTSKTTTGFTLSFAGAETTTVNFTVVRR